MQTLLDPFEAAPRPVALAESRWFPAPGAIRRGPSLDAELDAVADLPVAKQPGADSSGRLRSWCSDEE